MQPKINYIDFISKYPVLYKYVPLNIANKIIEGGTIKFTKCTKLNDPFEYNIANWDCSNIHQSDKVVINWIQTIQSDKLSILSLSQKFDIILLWSYYACGHKGVCIGYDTKYLVNYILNNKDLNQEMLMCSVVKYPKKRILSNDLIEKIPGIINYGGVFFNIIRTKNILWNSEKEVRLASKSVPDIPIPIGIECIKEIYIGGSFKLNDPEIIKSFFDLIKKNFKGKIMQMGYNYEMNTLLAEEYSE